MCDHLNVWQQIPMEEVQELAVQGLPAVRVFHEDFDKFTYPPRTLVESRTTAVRGFSLNTVGVGMVCLCMLECPSVCVCACVCVCVCVYV